MRFSQLFCPTLKETPKDAEVLSHQLMLRAGFIRKVSSGIYNLLPLGLKVIRKYEAIVREEMTRIGAQEVLMPAVCPAELWQESGRWDKYGNELLRIKDRHGNNFCFGPTHEEVITDLVRQNVRSYRELPLTLYQIQTKFRDEIRPRFGLMRGREFGMKDAYSFHGDQACLDRCYADMRQAYERIFKRCGLSFCVVQADSGAIGGSVSAEFMVTAKSGEDVVLTCPSCGYAANLEAAELLAPEALSSENNKPAFEKVNTPGVTTIQAVSDFLKLSSDHFVKTLIYEADEEPVAVLVRGDHEVNECKLKKVLNCDQLTLGQDALISKVTGAPQGFAGPIGLAESVQIVADLELQQAVSVVVGANEQDFHFVNVVPERDFSVTRYSDIRNATEGDLCPRCKKDVYTPVRGIEVGHIFQLGRVYSELMKATYLDENGRASTYLMGCYGIGIGRTVAAAIEQHHDDAGICWPVSLAPFEAVLIVASHKDASLMSAAEAMFKACQDVGIDVLLDDRRESIGRKFKDAELIGIPFQVVIGNRYKQDEEIEIKSRQTGEVTVASRSDLPSLLKTLLAEGLKGLSIHGS